MQVKGKKILMVVNVDSFFLSHRKEIAIATLNQGYNITIVTKDTGHKKEIEKIGLNVIDLPINPTGKSILQEIKTLFFLLKLYKREQPDIVHHVGLKIILWGSIAARITKIKGVVNAVSGLGFLFSQEKISIYANLILKFIKYANNRDNIAFIFQNADDIKLFMNNHVVTKRQITLIKGSGVDLNEFNYTKPHTNDKIRILFPARILKDKGALEFIKVAQLLKTKWYDKVLFVFAGDCSSTNPTALNETELKENMIEDYLIWIGYRDDMKLQYIKSDIVVLPSYREGLPKSLIEACAIGRPIVTTDVPGCRECVKDGENGYLVQPRNAEELAEKIEILIKDKNKRELFGKNSRIKAEKEFSIENVIEKHLRIYNSLSHK